jgi:hypothetical protein
VAAFEDIQCRRSVVSDTLQLLTDQAKQWREKIDQLEAGQHLDRNEALASLGQLLDVCQNLRYAILSEDCTANWKTKEELHEIVDRIDTASIKRRRYLDLAEFLGNGTVTHRRERTRQERLKQRDAAVAELMEISALPSPPDLPGPEVDEWLDWACNLDDSSGDKDLQQLQKLFPRLDDFVRQLEIEMWQSAPAQNGKRERENNGAAIPETSPAASSVEAAPPVEEKSSVDLEASAATSEDPAAVEAAVAEPDAVEEPAAEVKAAPVFSGLEPFPPIAEDKDESAADEGSSATAESGKLCFFPPDEVGKFARVLTEGKDSRQVRGLLAISHWLTPADQNPVLNATCGIRAQIGYAGSSDLLPVSPDQAYKAIESDTGVLLFTGGADLLRWGLAQRDDDRIAGIASVRRLSKNQIKSWFKELHKIELAEPQVEDMYNLTHGVPLLVGELHRLVVPDPKTPPTWLGFMIWTTVKTNFDRRLPVVARELRNGSAAVRLTEREIRVLKMVAIASDNSTSKTLASHLQEKWDQYSRPELEALSSGDEESVALLQGLGLLPMRRDFGLSPIQALMPLGPGDPLRQIVSYL